MESIRNTITVEIPVNDRNNHSFRFPDDSILRGKTIVGIGVRGQNSGGTRKAVSGRTLVSNNGLAVSFITLKQDAKAVIAAMPIEDMVTDRREGRYLPVMIKGFSPSQSWIEASDSAALTDGTSYEVTFEYID